MSKNKAGFTLVELLVVITIIAILSVVGMTVFGSVQQRARDARRRGDIDAIAKALEVKKTATGYVVLNADQFASGTIPLTDPQNNTYCANSTKDAQPADITAKDCSDSTGWAAVGTTNPPAGTSWKICAYLEYPAGAYCRASSQ